MRVYLHASYVTETYFSLFLFFISGFQDFESFGSCVLFQQQRWSQNASKSLGDHTVETFNDFEKEAFGKHCWKRRKCW